jgi:hypothetical protein
MVTEASYKRRLELESWLKSQGFAYFGDMHGPNQIYEDRSLVNNGRGIRVTICDDVADVECPYLKEHHLAMSTTEVRQNVARMLLVLGRLRI